MPAETENELAPSEETIESFAALDLPARFDDLEHDQPGETGAMVDFDALLKQRQAVELRLTGLKHINPESEFRGDDSYAVMRDLEDWFGHEISFTDDDIDETTEQKIREHIALRYGELLERIKNRIQKECGNLGSLNVMAEVSGLLATPEENAKHQQEIERITFQPDGSAASYSPSEGKVYINERYTKLTESPKDLIEALADEGFVAAYTTMHHELIHSQQFPPPSEREKQIKKIALHALNLAVIGLAIKEFGFFEAGTGLVLLNKISPLIAIGIMEMRKRMESPKSHTIVVETQAYLGSNRFAGNEDVHTPRGTEHRRMFSSLTEFAEHMGKYDVMRTPGDTDKLIIAYNQIRRLYALGLNDAEVGELTKDAKWRKKELNFDKLGEKIQELTEAKGLTEDDVENLVEAEDIKSIIYFEKVKAIAREELRKTFLELQPIDQARWQLRAAARREEEKKEKE